MVSGRLRGKTKVTTELANDTTRRRLVELEAIVERGLETFLDVGNALMEIRNLRLYRETHSTFELYCKERFGFSASRGRQLIAAAKTVTDVTLHGLPAPNTEGEARALAKQIRHEGEQAVLDVMRDLRE